MRKIYNIYISFVVSLIKIFASLIPSKKQNIILIDIAKYLSRIQAVKINEKISIFFNITSADSIFRADTFLTKEPETLDWINSFSTEDVLWDIGANIGVYSLYAGKKGTNVISFEPSFANYSLLNRNIILNSISNKVRAYNLAFSDEKIATYFNMGDTEEGGACNQIGNANEVFNYSGLGERKVVFNQGAICFTIDQAINELKISFPNHIKIDVDGVEPLIIKGGLQTLKDKRLKSLLIEINENEVSNKDIVTILTELGFTHRRFIPTDLTHPDILNYIFYR